MNLADFAENLLAPPILFFVLGMSATLLGSDLDLPAPIPKLMSLFLLFAIGFKGGVALNAGGIGSTVLATLGAAMLASVLVPLWTYAVLRKKLGPADAAGVAATYGSVSAVTFITAAAFLGERGIPFSGHMVAAMALMESPAIIIGVALARRGLAVSAPAGGDDSSPALVKRPKGIDWVHLGRDAFLNGSVFLLLGSLLVGLLAGPRHTATMKPFIDTLFPGVLTLFLLDMGIVAARRLSDLRRAGIFATLFALGAPLVNATLGLGLATLIGLGHGDALLLIVLCASASYIAVPAALRVALPEANPSLYVTLSLALTFPFNILIGIPLYDLAASLLTSR